MKNRFKFILIFIFILLFLLPACSLDESVIYDTSKGNNSSVNLIECSFMLDESCNSDKGIYTLYPRYVRDGKILTRANGRIDSQFILLKFFDYTAIDEYVLCNQPNCNHDSVSCNAFFEVDFAEVNGNYAIFEVENKIYVIVNNKIYEINEDGTNRKCVFTIPKQYYSSGYSSVHAYMLNDELYFEVKKINENVKSNFSGDLLNNKSAFIYNLLKIETNNWDFEKIYSYEDDGYTEWLGISNNKSFYIYQDEMDILTEFNQEAYDAMFNDRETRLFSKDLNTKKEDVIFSGKSIQCDKVVFKNSNIYYHDREAGQIIELDTANNEKRVLVSDLFEYVTFFDNDLIDGKLLYYVDYQNSDAYNSTIPLNVHCCVDVKTKEIQIIDYQINNEDNTLGFLRKITMVTPDYFIIAESCFPPTYKYTYAKVDRKGFLNNDFSVESIDWVYGE